LPRAVNWRAGVRDFRPAPGGGRGRGRMTITHRSIGVARAAHHGGRQLAICPKMIMRRAMPCPTTDRAEQPSSVVRPNRMTWHPGWVTDPSCPDPDRRARTARVTPVATWFRWSSSGLLRPVANARVGLDIASFQHIQSASETGAISRRPTENHEGTRDTKTCEVSDGVRRRTGDAPSRRAHRAFVVLD
jgi:hypothetical protein